MERKHAEVMARIAYSAFRQRVQGPTDWEHLRVEIQQGWIDGIIAASSVTVGAPPRCPDCGGELCCRSCAATKSPRVNRKSARALSGGGR